MNLALLLADFPAILAALERDAEFRQAVLEMLE